MRERLRMQPSVEQLADGACRQVFHILGRRRCSWRVILEEAVTGFRCGHPRPLLEHGIAEIEDLPAIDQGRTGDENQKMIGVQPGGLQA